MRRILDYLSSRLDDPIIYLYEYQYRIWNPNTYTSIGDFLIFYMYTILSLRTVTCILKRGTNQGKGDYTRTNFNDCNQSS